MRPSAKFIPRPTLKAPTRLSLLHTAYREMYTGLPDHLTGLFTLVRVVKQGTRIKQSVDIRIYVYDINPTPTHIDD